MTLTLVKERETVSKLVTVKTGKPKIDVQVQFLVDVSLSTKEAFKRGEFGRILQRSAAFADQVDPDGEVEMFAFATQARMVGAFKAEQFDTIENQFLEAAEDVLWGGTDYARGYQSVLDSNGNKLSKIKSMFGGLFGKKEPVSVNPPRLLIQLTDGADFGSSYDAAEAIDKLIKQNYFILALGINRNASEFGLLHTLDSRFEGFSFMQAKDFYDLDKDAFYDLLLNDEFVRWLKLKGIA